MKWQSYKRGFAAFLHFEKSHQPNTIEAYLHDFDLLADFFDSHYSSLGFLDIEPAHITEFVHHISSRGLSNKSLARIVSGVRAFFRYLIMEDIIKENPAELLERPRLPVKLPEHLSLEEINRIVAAIDLSNPLGNRNRAIIETLYGAGLRVSELTDLHLSNLNFKEDYFIITGKGNKQRLVPMGSVVKKCLLQYIEHDRSAIETKKSQEDYVFLSKHGTQLTREMIFVIVKTLSKTAGISKKVSPHIFRHSFATHLVQAGADLRVVQELLGHESITTTEIYTHLDRSYLLETLISYHPRSKAKKNIIPQ
mgnify:CR=1 FL=1